MSKRLYSLDVTIQATAYIVAANAAEAQAKAERILKDTALELPTGPHGADGLTVSGLPFAALLASSELPALTLSPAMTIVHPSITGDRVKRTDS